MAPQASGLFGRQVAYNIHANACERSIKFKR
jgi:hypothetical protein